MMELWLSNVAHRWLSNKNILISYSAATVFDPTCSVFFPKASDIKSTMHFAVIGEPS